MLINIMILVKRSKQTISETNTIPYGYGSCN
jgi:hypothetical protein